MFRFYSITHKIYPFGNYFKLPNKNKNVKLGLEVLTR